MRISADTRFAVVPDWLLRLPISAQAVRAYATLALYASRDGRSYPSRRRLAADMGCSTSTMDRSLAELVQARALRVETRADDDGRQTVNEYVLRTSRPDLGEAPSAPSVTREVLTGEEGDLVTREDPGTKEDQELEIPSGSTPAPRVGGDPRAAVLVRLLRDLMVDNGVRAPTESQLRSWEAVAERMLRLDDRDPAEAADLIRWCQGDEFWRGNVLSMGKFRDRYDQLRLQAQRRTGSRWRHPLDEMMDRVKEEMARAGDGTDGGDGVGGQARPGLPGPQHRRGDGEGLG